MDQSGTINSWKTKSDLKISQKGIEPFVYNILQKLSVCERINALLMLCQSLASLMISQWAFLFSTLYGNLTLFAFILLQVEGDVVVVVVLVVEVANIME